MAFSSPRHSIGKHTVAASKPGQQLFFQVSSGRAEFTRGTRCVHPTPVFEGASGDRTNGEECVRPSPSARGSSLLGNVSAASVGSLSSQGLDWLHFVSHGESAGTTRQNALSRSPGCPIRRYPFSYQQGSRGDTV